MSTATIDVKIKGDLSLLTRKFQMIAWRMDRLDFLASLLFGRDTEARARNERRRQARLLEVDRRHQAACNLDIQLVTMNDGHGMVCRVVTKPIGGWA